MCEGRGLSAGRVNISFSRSKHIKGSKERYLLGQNQTNKFSGVISFIKLQNDT